MQLTSLTQGQLLEQMFNVLIADQIILSSLITSESPDHGERQTLITMPHE